MTQPQKKQMTEGKIVKIEYHNQPDKVVIQLKTKDKGVLNIIYQAHHSYFTQYGKKLQVGNEIKTLYYESPGNRPHVGITPIQMLDSE